MKRSINDDRKGKALNLKRFFNTDIKPWSTMFGFSLRNSILLISAIDVIVGAIDFLRFIQYSLLYYMGSQSFQDILVLFSFIIGSLSTIFAFNSFKSVMILKHKYLYIYSQYKQFEFISQTIIWIIYEIIDFNNGYVSYPMIAYIAFTRLIFFYLAWIIWSAYYHIFKGNTFIVIEGKIID